MTLTPLTPDQCELAIRLLWPEGQAFEYDDGSEFDEFSNAISDEMCRVENRVSAAFKEMFPQLAVETLDEWTDTFPQSECLPPPVSDAEQTARILETLRDKGGIHRQRFFDIAAANGFTIEELVEFHSSLADIAVADDACVDILYDAHADIPCDIPTAFEGWARWSVVTTNDANKTLLECLLREKQRATEFVTVVAPSFLVT